MAAVAAAAAGMVHSSTCNWRARLRCRWLVEWRRPLACSQACASCQMHPLRACQWRNLQHRRAANQSRLPNNMCGFFVVTLPPRSHTAALLCAGHASCKQLVANLQACCSEACVSLLAIRTAHHAAPHFMSSQGTSRIAMCMAAAGEQERARESKARPQRGAQAGCHAYALPEGGCESMGVQQRCRAAGGERVDCAAQGCISNGGERGAQAGCCACCQPRRCACEPYCHVLCSIMTHTWRRMLMLEIRPGMQCRPYGLAVRTQGRLCSSVAQYGKSS